MVVSDPILNNANKAIENAHAGQMGHVSSCLDCDVNALLGSEVYCINCANNHKVVKFDDK